MFTPMKKAHIGNSCMCLIIKVNPLVQNSNSFLEDLRKINQLKESPYQYDVNPDESILSKPLEREKRGRLKM